MLDATLKEITAALLESDVNVKLVATLRQKVKAKVKAALDGSDKSKDLNRKHLIQKVTSSVRLSMVDAYSPGVRLFSTNLFTLWTPGLSHTSQRKANQTSSWLLASRYVSLDCCPRE